MKNQIGFLFFLLGAVNAAFGQEAPEWQPNYEVQGNSVTSFLDSGSSTYVLVSLLVLAAGVWLIFAIGAWRMAVQEEQPEKKQNTLRRATPPNMATSRTIGSFRERYYEAPLAAASSPRGMSKKTPGQSDRDPPVGN